jgi:hypothetical protein
VHSPRLMKKSPGREPTTPKCDLCSGQKVTFAQAGASLARESLLAGTTRRARGQGFSCRLGPVTAATQ